MCWRESRGLKPCREDDVILDTPDCRQRDDYSCGAVCLEILFRYHGVGRPRWVGLLPSPHDGLQPDAVKAAAYAVLGNVLAGPMTVGILKGLVADGKPVLCPVTLPGDACGHWLVVRGVTRGRVYYSCPLTGHQSMPLAAWAAAWRDEPAEQSIYNNWGVTGWPG
jgi:hypothetical protein